MKDLTVLPPEAVVFQIERIASRLGPSTVELALPLNAAKRPKLSLAALAGDQVVFQDGINSPAVHSRSRLGGMCSSCPKFSPIHAASFEGSQRMIRWDLRNGYSSHAAGPCCISSAHTTSGCPGRTSTRAGLRRRKCRTAKMTGTAPPPQRMGQGLQSWIFCIFPVPQGRRLRMLPLPCSSSIFLVRGGNRMLRASAAAFVQIDF